MTRSELLQYMLAIMKREKIGKRKFAAKYKLTYSHLCRIFSGKADPGPGFLKNIGVARTKQVSTSYSYSIIQQPEEIIS